MGVLPVESVFPLRKFSFLFFVHLVKHLKKKNRPGKSTKSICGFKLPFLIIKNPC